MQIFFDTLQISLTFAHILIIHTTSYRILTFDPTFTKEPQNVCE